MYKMIQTTWIDNGGHAYLKVRIEDFKKVVTDPTKVSKYSGMDATHVFLEEDCDAAVFANDAKAKGYQWTNYDTHYDENYRCPKNYNAATIFSVRAISD